MTVLRFGLAASCAAAALLCAQSGAMAAGFYIQEQSVVGLGRAFAGSAAATDDVAGIYFNPAVMTGLEAKKQVELGASLLIPKAKLTDAGSTAGGTAADNPYDPTPVPHGAAVLPLMDGKMWVGVHVGAPFGLASKYDQTWFGRYDSVETDLKTYNLAPSIAYQLTDTFSIGAALDIQRADVKISSAVNIGGDGLFTTEGDSWAYGATLGVRFQPNEALSLGLSYRTDMSHDVEGDITVATPGLNTRVDGTANLDLPDIITLGVDYKVNPEWRVLGGISHFGWSKFGEIDVNGTVPLIGNPAAVRQDYKDTMAYSLGVEYHWDEDLTVRAGIQFDETPTQDGFRTSRTPDGDRTWLSTGATYKFNDWIDLSAAYTYIHIASEQIDVTRGAATIRANTEGNVHILAVSAKMAF